VPWVYVPWSVIKLFLSFKTVFFRLFKHLILSTRDKLLSEYSQQVSAPFRMHRWLADRVWNYEAGCNFIIIMLLWKLMCEIRTSGARKHIRSHESTRVWRLSCSHIYGLRGVHTHTHTYIRRQKWLHETPPAAGTCLF